MGINTDLIVSKFQNEPGIAEMLPNFICSICDDLFEDVVAVKCQHNFCRSCLTRWIETQTDKSHVPCPQCRSIFHPTFGIKDSRIIRNLLSVFQFKCSIESCKIVINYDELNLHREKCLYSRILCTFCDEEMLRRDLKTHEMGCINYIKYQKSELEVQNSLLNKKISLLNTENNTLKAQHDEYTKKLGFL